MKTRRTIAVIAASSLIAGCGSSSSPASRTTRATDLTDAQTLVLARVLENNRDRGGARFVAALAIDGRPVLARGRVDFRSGRGTAVLRPAADALGPPRRYFWTRDAVLAQAAPDAARYTRQAPDPAGDPVHAMIGFVNLLAADTIDNTTNIADQDARLVGRTRIGGAAVDEYRYGANAGITLWILRDEGLLRRVRTTRVPGGLTVDLVTHEPVKIRLPAHVADG